MITDRLNTTELFTSLDNVSSELLIIIASLSETSLNTIPFKYSWTAAQTAAHITKSNSSIAQALNMEAKPAERDAGERVQELKGIFLDFTTKFQSPDFILPTQDTYEKEVLIARLKRSIERLKETAGKVDLSEIISLPAFGEITKLELLHFVLYHTQRHLHQLKNIMRIIEIQ
ncbi:MAG: DinB family protein [Ginsengibacter sp.]